MGAFKNGQGLQLTDAEMEKAEGFLKTLARLQVDILIDDEERQQRLKESPGGFHLEKKGYCCRICHGEPSGTNSWFDEHGLKCRFCQEAINQKIMPPSVATDGDSWYTETELETNFALIASVRRQWIKQGLLICRTAARSDKRADLQIFLITDNSAMLPPKKLVQGHMFSQVIDGQERHSFGPWYWFVDPREHLKGHMIADYLKFVPAGGVDPGTIPNS